MATNDALTDELFTAILDKLCGTLTEQSEKSKYATSNDFELAIRNELKELLSKYKIDVDFDPHPYVFPDIVLGKHGIEVKFTTKDTWRSVANSVFESTRSESVEQIFVVFGKMGGKPEIKWGRYDDCVIHVRTSHVPRFEVQLGAKESLFAKIGVKYQDFRKLSIADRMKHIREYARGRLKDGQQLWWLQEKEDGHTLPIAARLYMSLEQEEKRKFRAEASLLCPEVVKASRSKHKYDNAALYLLLSLIHI